MANDEWLIAERAYNITLNGIFCSRYYTHILKRKIFKKPFSVNFFFTSTNNYASK